MKRRRVFTAVTRADLAFIVRPEETGPLDAIDQVEDVGARSSITAVQKFVSAEAEGADLRDGERGHCPDDNQDDGTREASGEAGDVVQARRARRDCFGISCEIDPVGVGKTRLAKVNTQRPTTWSFASVTPVTALADHA